VEVRSLGKTRRNGRQETVRSDCFTRRGSARGSQAVCSVPEEWKAASKKQIPSAAAAEESPKEGRTAPITRRLIDLPVCNENQIEIKNKTLADAVERRRLDLVELLVRHGAEVSSVPLAFRDNRS
jgi:hypothetical protein